MTCCSNIPASCRFSAVSCNCCSCKPSIELLEASCDACRTPVVPNPRAHHHEACSCIHPIMICACQTCSNIEDEAKKTTNGNSCHGHHSMANFESAIKSKEAENKE